MKFFEFMVLAFLLLVPAGLPVAGAAQYERDRDRYYRDGELGEIAHDLSQSADHVWGMVRSDREQNTDVGRALRNFARNTRRFAARADESDRETFRSAAQQLVREAEDIGRLIDRTQMSSHLRDDWDGVEAQVDRLSSYYGIPFSGGRDLARTDPYRDDRYGRDDDWRYGDEYGSYRSGAFRWRGRVDGSDHIFLRGRRVNVRHVQAQPITDATYDLTAPLPRANVDVQVRPIRGRGRIQLIQQPSASNDYTAGVLIEDDEAGSDYYEFELVW